MISRRVHRISKIARYIVIFMMTGWSAAAAATQMWGAMVFFAAYVIALYWLGIIVDRHVEAIWAVHERQEKK